MNAEQTVGIEACCVAANDFIKQYYRMFDLTREKVSELYLNSGVLVYNGSHVAGEENIQKFLDELPDMEHRLKSLIAQPMINGVPTENMTYIVQSGGTVEFEDNNYEYIAQNFQQSFVLKAVQGNWKIVSDIYRSYD